MYYVYIVIITLQLNIRMHKYMEYKDLVATASIAVKGSMEVNNFSPEPMPMVTKDTAGVLP